MEKVLLSAFFPHGVLDFFEVKKYSLETSGYIFYLEEKNILPEGYDRSKLESKGFYEGGEIVDFPLRGKRCLYKVRRRKWLVKQEGKIITRDWNIVAKGTRTTNEFATFLKGLNR